MSYSAQRRHGSTRGGGRRPTERSVSTHFAGPRLAAARPGRDPGGDSLLRHAADNVAGAGES